MIYLDSAATTPMSKEVVDAMMPFLSTEFGNPNSVHELGVNARRAVDKAREQVASAINADPSNIIFTSGGSEANNMVLKGYPRDFTSTYSDEHTSTLMAMNAHGLAIRLFDAKDWLAKQDITYTFTSRDKQQFPLRELVWYMYVNNETGKKNPVCSIGEACSKHEYKKFGTDCVQALGFERLDVEEMKCDFMSLSSHKIHGPKGIGALYVRDRDSIRSLISGGSSQEFGLRGGTENVAGIVGFGEACEIATKNLEENRARILHLRDLFVRQLNGVRYIINCYDESKILSIRFPGVDAETFVLAMSTMGVALSAGSACRSKESTPNRALLAQGLTESQARNTVRFSFMESNTDEEVITAVKCLKQVIKMLNK